MRFLRLSLENWRNFTHVEIPLEERVFLVGPNASGKSNLLDVFRFLRDIARVGGGLQSAVATRGGVSRLRCLAARRYSDVSIDVQIGNNPEKPDWQYSIRFNQDNLRRPLLKEEVVVHNSTEVLRRPGEEDRDDPERLTQTHLEQVNTNRAFREVADFFSTVRYLHIVPQLIRDPDRSIGRTADPFGGDFLEQLARTPQKTLDSRLTRIKKALKIAVPQLKDLELKRDERGTPHLRGLYEHWRPRGAWQTEDQFSDGTLHLLGLLWSFLEGTGPLLLEEPELSLHAEVVRYVPQMMSRVARRRGRQILLSTHSSDLLRDDGIGWDEVFLLIPRKEGTQVNQASADKEIRALLEGGETIPDIVMPKTKPQDVRQLALFGD